MSNITITQAAKLAGISRQHLYKSYINPGKISVTKDRGKVSIDASELLRVFPDATIMTSTDDENVQLLTHKIDNSTHDVNELVSLLKTQLAESKDRELQLRQETQEREAWFKSQLEKATHLLENKTTEKKRKKFLGIF